MALPLLAGSSNLQGVSQRDGGGPRYLVNPQALVASMFGRRPLRLWGLFVGSYSVFCVCNEARRQGRGGTLRFLSLRLALAWACEGCAPCMAARLPHSSAAGSPGASASLIRPARPAEKALSSLGVAIDWE